ncbi:hypothetical protein [Streptomyces mirabilis]|uniref:hypothetical protein n=1 Tax=Streptomyces mirabilis TaxID=68239 RepID=UPI0036E06AE3
MRSQVRTSPYGHAALAAVVARLTAASATACSTSSTNTSNSTSTGGATGSGKMIQAVAAENFWGSVATWLGGSRLV